MVSILCTRSSELSLAMTFLLLKEISSVWEEGLMTEISNPLFCSSLLSFLFSICKSCNLFSLWLILTPILWHCSHPLLSSLQFLSMLVEYFPSPQCASLFLVSFPSFPSWLLSCLKALMLLTSLLKIRLEDSMLKPGLFLTSRLRMLLLRQAASINSLTASAPMQFMLRLRHLIHLSSLRHLAIREALKSSILLFSKFNSNNPSFSSSTTSSPLIFASSALSFRQVLCQDKISETLTPISFSWLWEKLIRLRFELHFKDGVIC